MNPDAYKNFICPQCAHELSRQVMQEQETYTCDGCRRVFPVVRFVPRFVDTNNYCDSFGFQWTSHRTTQLDSYSGKDISRRRLFDTTGWSADLQGEMILEAGSGAGRFTQVLLTTKAQVFSFDYSAAVDANRGNNAKAGNLVLFQADIYRIPLRKKMFDKILCLGVLQHTPDPRKAFLAMAPFLKPGGQICIDVYKKTIVSLLQWKYILRPLVKKMDKQKLYAYSKKSVQLLGPVAAIAGRVLGPAGKRLLPIADYSDLGFSRKSSREWSVLDTFDMYAPEHDHPQTLKSVRRWFQEAGLSKIEVRYGPNGIVGKGTREF